MLNENRGRWNHLSWRKLWNSCSPLVWGVHSDWKQGRCYLTCCTQTWRGHGRQAWPHRASSEQITEAWPCICCCQHLSAKHSRVPNTSPPVPPTCFFLEPVPPEAESPPRSRQSEGRSGGVVDSPHWGPGGAGWAAERSTQRKKEATELGQHAQSGQ